MVALPSPVKLELGILHTIMWHTLALAESVFQLGIYMSEHGHQGKELPTCLNNVNPSYAQAYDLQHCSWDCICSLMHVVV
jgi:hypothetical protein